MFPAHFRVKVAGRLRALLKDLVSAWRRTYCVKLSNRGQIEDENVSFF